MDDSGVWCKSINVQIHEGSYWFHGEQVEVVQAKSGRFYAKSKGKYAPGLIYLLRADLEKK